MSLQQSQIKTDEDFYEDFDFDIEALQRDISDVPLLTIAEEYSGNNTNKSNDGNSKTN